jgi:hypothetical protein
VPVRDISPFTWKVLRAAARSKTPPTGRALRISPTPKTRDGTFLDALVAAGLLEAVGVDPLPAGAAGPVARAPVQFRTRYALTPRGAHAAEYGEYEYELKPAQTAPPVPAPLPIKGKRGRKPGGR